jgi:hypothetical protein
MGGREGGNVEEKILEVLRRVRGREWMDSYLLGMWK